MIDTPSTSSDADNFQRRVWVANFIFAAFSTVVPPRATVDAEIDMATESL
jgi:hypothetical protein